MSTYGTLVALVLGALAVVAVWGLLLVWAIGQIGEAVKDAHRVGSEAAIRSVIGYVAPPMDEQGRAKYTTVESHDGFEEHPFAQEQVVSPEERERLMARLAPWDHEAGNSFE